MASLLVFSALKQQETGCYTARHHGAAEKMGSKIALNTHINSKYHINIDHTPSQSQCPGFSRKPSAFPQKSSQNYQKWDQNPHLV